MAAAAEIASRSVVISNADVFASREILDRYVLRTLTGDRALSCLRARIERRSVHRTRFRARTSTSEYVGGGTCCTRGITDLPSEGPLDVGEAGAGRRGDEIRIKRRGARAARVAADPPHCSISDSGCDPIWAPRAMGQLASFAGCLASQHFDIWTWRQTSCISEATRLIRDCQNSMCMTEPTMTADTNRSLETSKLALIDRVWTHTSIPLRSAFRHNPAVQKSSCMRGLPV
jgi:hypothetical protein